MADTGPVCYLTTTGRSTSRPHRIEIWFLEMGGSVYLLSGDGQRADWVRNLMADSHVLLELPGRPAAEYRASIGPFDGEQVVRERIDARYYGVRPQLTDWARTALVVRLEPADPVSGG